MTSIRDVAEEINRVAVRFKMGGFQQVRRDVKGRRPSTYKIFSKSSIFERYAFHSGGRTEIQYNIGYGKYRELRYGLAFSLETSRSLPDIGVFEAKVKRFNEFVTRNPRKFSNMWLWYLDGDDSGEYERVRPIDWSSVRKGTFIFIGKFLDKELDQLTVQDYEEILRTFDDLLDVYRYVEGDSTVSDEWSDIQNYVVYHNADVMGISCHEFEEGRSFRIVTNKSVTNLLGAKVWLVSGEGKPRKYFLCYWFIVDDIGQAEEDSRFKFYAKGTVGRLFRPPILLNRVAWFGDFRKSQQNFSMGLRRIEEWYVAGFEELAGDYEARSIEGVHRVGAGFGRSETNRLVEQAAVELVTACYESQGWSVQSVELERRGFDLLCVKGDREEHVEVKGVRGELVSFIITAGEVNRSRSDKHFVLYVVVSALSERPQLFRYSAEEFTTSFSLKPLTFRADVKEP